MTSNIPGVDIWARDKGLSLQDALQNFLQVIVLKNISLESARFIGGTALVWAHGNPRFSEDIDFGGVTDPLALKKDIARSAREMKDWLGIPVKIQAPRQGKATWKLKGSLNPSQSIRLHVDTQSYPALTHFPALIRFPGISPFIVASVEIEEIMADKIIALARRRYLSGRDLFDLWFHWLKIPNREGHDQRVKNFLMRKLKQRGLAMKVFSDALESRLKNPALERSRLEWRRYLPAPFQKELVQKDILTHAGRLPEIIQ